MRSTGSLSLPLLLLSSISPLPLSANTFRPFLLLAFSLLPGLPLTLSVITWSAVIAFAPPSLSRGAIDTVNAAKMLVCPADLLEDPFRRLVSGVLVRVVLHSPNAGTLL